MQYVYVLRDVEGTLYTGCTSDLRKRIVLHNAGKVKSTKRRGPLELIYYEAYKNQKDAYAREQYFKSGWGRAYVKKVLRNTLHD